MEVAGVIIAIVAIVAVGFLIARLYERRRVEALVQFAEQNGMEFSATPPPQLDGRMRTFPLFELGRSRRRKNYLMATADDRSICLFEYGYTTGGGKNTQHHRQTVCWFESPLLSLPQFSLRRRHFFDRISEWFGSRGLAVTEDVEFNRLYIVKGFDESAVRELFEPSVVASCLQRAGQYQVEGIDDQMIVYRRSRRLPAKQLGEFLQDAYEVFAAFQRAESRSAFPG